MCECTYCTGKSYCGCGHHDQPNPPAHPRIARGTMARRRKVAECKTDAEKLMQWIRFGFDAEEAFAMVKGYTVRDRYKVTGGIFRVGYVEWAQAISPKHAIKLYDWNFGYNGEEVAFIANLPDRFRLTEVLEIPNLDTLWENAKE